MKISVIIPVYNTEPYLREAVDSVLRQNCGDMEILLLNDASEDGSGKICDEYAARYTHVRAVHLDHRGVGNARNEGLRLARGEYIVFVDADDFVSSEDSIRRLTDLLDTSQADVAVGNYCRLWDGRLLEAAKHSEFSQTERESRFFRFSGFFTVGTLSYVWGKAYRRSFLQKYGIRFGSYEYAEDKAFNFQCFIEQAQYVFLDDIVYVYRKNDNSISHKHQHDSAQCWLRIASDLKQTLQEKNLYETYGDLVAFTVNFAAFFDGKSAYCGSEKKTKAIKSVLKTYADSPTAYQCFCCLSKGKYIEKSFGAGWSLMMWGFAFSMKIKALSLLAWGIKLLIDLRIDERLSDTGIRNTGK